MKNDRTKARKEKVREGKHQKYFEKGTAVKERSHPQKSRKKGIGNSTSKPRRIKRKIIRISDWVLTTNQKPPPRRIDFKSG